MIRFPSAAQRQGGFAAKSTDCHDLLRKSRNDKGGSNPSAQMEKGRGHKTSSFFMQEI